MRIVVALDGDLLVPQSPNLGIAGQVAEIARVVARDDGARGVKPPELAKKAYEKARAEKLDTVIIDTAGRLAIDEALMAELDSIKAEVKPENILLVCDAMIGQDAVNTASAFHNRLNIDGIILTKLDGDARGGAALSLRATIGKPIKFIGVGERLEALEKFHPDRLASRILGMGDIVTLVEKVQERYDEEKAVQLEEKLRKSQFTLEDFLEQLQEVKKMGPLSQVLGMLPGMNRMPKDAEVDESALGRIEAIIRSMTPQERRQPQILNGSRRRRIALGSGTSVQEVNKLMKQYEQMQRMVKTLSKGGRGARALRGMRFP